MTDVPRTVPLSLPENLRLDAVPYQPDHVCPPRGLLALALLALVVAPVIGWLVQRVSQTAGLGLLGRSGIAVVFIAPFVARLGAWAVVWGKVRQPTLAGLSGLLLIATFALGHLYGSHQRFVKIQIAEAAQNDIAAEPIDFPDYLKRRASDLLWLLVPALLIARACYTSLSEPARKPFCPVADEWKQHLAGRTIRIVGTSDELQRLIAGGELARLATYSKVEDDGLALLIPPNAEAANDERRIWELTAFVSPKHYDPDTTVELQLAGAVPTIRGLSLYNVVGIWSLPPAALRVLETVWDRPVKPEAPTE